MFSLFDLLFVNFDGLFARLKSNWGRFLTQLETVSLFFSTIFSLHSENHTQKTESTFAWSSEQLYNNPICHMSPWFVQTDIKTWPSLPSKKKKHWANTLLNDKIISFFFYKSLKYNISRTASLKTPTKQSWQVSERRPCVWWGRGPKHHYSRDRRLRIKSLQRTRNSRSGRDSQSQRSGSLQLQLESALKSAEDLQDVFTDKHHSVWKNCWVFNPRPSNTSKKKKRIFFQKNTINILARLWVGFQGEVKSSESSFHRWEFRTSLTPGRLKVRSSRLKKGIY